MTNLFLQIAETVPRMHGWCTVNKANNLAAIICALRPNIAVEVGVYAGRSLIPMALAMKHLGSGIIFAIDPWEARASEEGQFGQHREWWGQKCNHELIYQMFLESVRKAGVQNCVKVIRKRSDEVEVPPSIDVLHLDGNHGEQAYKDIRRFAPAVRVGGIVILDDLTWEGGAVGRCEKFIQEIGFIQLSRTYTKPKGDDDWATYQRVK